MTITMVFMQIGIYTTLATTNPSGWHFFSGTALAALPAAYEIVVKSETTRGEMLTIRTVVGGTIVADDVLLDRNGYHPTRNLTRDTLVMRIDQLAKLPLGIQAAFRTLEHLPGGGRGR